MGIGGPFPGGGDVGPDTGAGAPTGSLAGGLFPASPEVDPLGQTPTDPFAQISDTVLLQAMNEGYARAKEARRERNRENELNWKALHRQMEFLNRKQPGQSRVVLPSLEVSLEQVAGQLTDQLVGFRTWFQCEYESGDPPLPDLSPDLAAIFLRRELDHLQIAGDYLPSSYGMRQLIYDSWKVALVESVITWKVSVSDVDQSVYDFPDEQDPTGAPQRKVKTKRRLKIEIVPYADHYPDPSPSRIFDIHELEVPIAELPDLGFDPDTIAKMRGMVSTEKEEQRRIRSGTMTSQQAPKHRVMLREWWGDLHDPNTGTRLCERVTFMTCGSSLVVKRPQYIRELLWHDNRPFLTVAPLPTPLSHVHHAFLDIARPLVETESELTNLVIDGGFNGIHGIKAVREYMMEDPTVIANGFVPGIVIKIAEGRGGDQAVVERIDTGTIPPETLEVVDRIGRVRQEAFRVNDLQLGRMPERKESATAITEISESSSDLFSSMAQRFEKSLEALIELCWLTMWQFLDDFESEGELAQLLGPDGASYVQALGAMSAQERFVLMANGIRFKVTGYKSMQANVKDYQKLLTLQNFISQNPALLMVYQQEFSPLKMFRVLYRALGIDPVELRRDPNEPMIPPEVIAGQSGAPQGNGGPPPQNPATAPMLASQAEQQMPTNPMGTRGVQGP